MCGLVGTVGWGTVDDLAAMNGLQTHRGPDGKGQWWREAGAGGPSVGLASARLAVIDVSDAGRMPMSNESGDVCIAYNGEVYNFPALRRGLERAGVIFRSGTDTEVVLRLYEREGPGFVRRLNGMFALAICDLRSGRPELLLARDHFGIKPLYYAIDGERLAFASEAKSLFALPGIEPRMAPEALNSYLTFLWVPEPETMFAGIKKLPAGHIARWQDGRFTLERYWDMPVPHAGSYVTADEAEIVSEMRERFRAAVHRQMVSDVPVGAFLSGGLDSGGIVAMMAERAAPPLRTYTITFPEEARVGENTLDDPRDAQMVADHFGAEHRELRVTPAVADLLPKLIWHMDDPVADPALIAAYLVCRSARDEVTVLLSGVGGDELLGGYRKHYVDRWARRYRHLPQSLRSVLRQSVEAMPTMRGSRMRGPVRLAKKMVSSAELPFDEAFIRNAVYQDRAAVGRLLTEDAADFATGDPFRTHRAAFDQVRTTDRLHQMLYVDSMIFMPSLNLLYNDKMSMANSLEVRVPFLDIELVEWAQRLPPNMKIKGSVRPITKYVFRRAMAGILPPKIIQNRKAGFGAPLDHWLAHGLREMVDEVLSEHRLKDRGLFEPAEVRRLIDAQREGGLDASMQIWQLLTLELWMDTFGVTC